MARITVCLAQVSQPCVFTGTVPRGAPLTVPVSVGMLYHTHDPKSATRPSERGSHPRNMIRHCHGQGTPGHGRGTTPNGGLWRWLEYGRLQGFMPGPGWPPLTCCAPGNSSEAQHAALCAPKHLKTAFASHRNIYILTKRASWFVPSLYWQALPGGLQPLFRGNLSDLPRQQVQVSSSRCCRCFWYRIRTQMSAVSEVGELGTLSGQAICRAPT